MTPTLIKTQLETALGCSLHFLKERHLNDDFFGDSSTYEFSTRDPANLADDLETGTAARVSISVTVSERVDRDYQRAVSAMAMPELEEVS